jgi:hypothetical protein
VQFQHAGDEIEAAGVKREEIGVGPDPHSAALRQEAERRVGGYDPLDPRSGAECA